MAKKRSLTRIVKRKSTDEAIRFYAMFPGILCAQDSDDDTRSIESFSTMATVDDNPGTGRVLDTYFFQPAGRRIERLAMRFTIRHLHPQRIEAFIDGEISYSRWLGPKLALSDVLQWIDEFRSSGPTVVAGLKSLVRQAQ